VVSARTNFAEALSVGLRASDLDYVGARRMDEALAVLAEDPMPSAVVVDLLSVPSGASGASDLCDAVRARDEGAQVPVIFGGSGKEEIKSTTDALLVGGDAYFQMPITVAKVVAKIATYIGCPVPDLPSSLELSDDTQAGDADISPGSEAAVVVERVRESAAQDDDFNDVTAPVWPVSAQRDTEPGERPRAISMPPQLEPNAPPRDARDSSGLLFDPSALDPSALDPSALDPANFQIDPARIDPNKPRSFEGTPFDGLAPRTPSAPSVPSGDDALTFSDEVTDAMASEAVAAALASARTMEGRPEGRLASNDEKTPPSGSPTAALVDDDAAAASPDTPPRERALAVTSPAGSSLGDDTDRGLREDSLFDNDEAERLAAAELELADQRAASRAEKDKSAEQEPIDEFLREQSTRADDGTGEIARGDEAARIADAEAKQREEEREAKEREAKEARAREQREREEEREREEKEREERERERRETREREERERAERDQQERAQREREQRERAERDERERETREREAREREERERAEKEARDAREEKDRLEREEAIRREAERAAAEQARAEEAARKAQAEEERLAELARARAAAEDEARRAAEEASARALEEEERLAALAMRRAAAEEDARRAAEEAAARALAEQEKLADLASQRAAAEEEAARAAEESAARALADEEKLAELAARRARAEEEARLAVEDAQRRGAAEEARVVELERKRAIAEEEEQRARADAEQRAHEERARIEDIERRRREVEEETARALEDAERKRAESTAELARIEERRRAAEAEAQAQLEDAERRQAEERARLEDLERRRREAEADAARAFEEAARREAEERARLDDLQRQRAETEQRIAREAEEAQRRAREAEESLAATERKEAEERAQLELLGVERERAEQEGRRVVEDAKRREEELRARLHELEAERQRATEEHARAEDARRKRAEEERRRLFEIEQAREQLEEEARKEAEARRAKELEEEARLADILAERQRVEADVRAALEDKERQLRLEEERLATIQRARSEAEIDSKRRAEEAERAASEAEERLLEARRERGRLEVEAAAELERLARVRAEEELARRELEERRARARLAFQTGRLDAVPTGRAPSGSDVGSVLRPSSEGEGTIVGGPPLPVVPGVWGPEAEPPPPPPFVALEPPAGRYIEGELASLLWSCHHLRVTGAVELDFDDGTPSAGQVALNPASLDANATVIPGDRDMSRVRTIYFEEGEPVLVVSQLPVDRPEEALLRAGLITTAKYNELRAGPLRSPRRTAAALAAEGALKNEELFPAVRGVLTEQIMSLLEHEGGSFRYVEQHAHSADRVRLEHTFDALLAEGVRRKYDEKRLWLVLGGPATLVGPDDRGRDLPPLSPEEKLALARLDGTRSVEDVIVETSLAAPVVLRTALIAVSCGAARLLARGVPVDPAERAAQRDRSLAIDRARIVDRLHAARNGDYFAFLGVDLHASSFEVQRAAERVRQRFDPLRYSDPVFADLRAALTEIVEVSFDAEAVLGDEALADGYRRNLLGQLQRPVKRRA
jgi:hypothetical protein